MSAVQRLQELRAAVLKLQLFAELPEGPTNLLDPANPRWWFYPWSDHAQRNLGLRIVPGASIEHWPWCDGAEQSAATLGTTLADSTANAYACTQLFDLTTEAQLLAARDRYPRDRDHLAAIFRITGESLTSLMPLEDMLQGDSLLAIGTSPEGRRQHLFHWLSRLDSSVERWSYLDFVQKRAAWNYTVPPEGLGIWRQAALVVSLRHHLSMDNPTIYVPDEECQHAFELLQLPAPYDTHIEAAPGNHDLFLPCDGSQSGADLLSYAVVFVSKAPAHLLDAWADAPLFQHVLIPIAEDPNGPWQLGFMKAAAAYDGLDQPELAWNMLVSGQFWVTRRGGPWRPFFDAARSLARRREWLDCTAALNDIAARAQLPPA